MSDNQLPDPEELVEGTVKEVKSQLKDAEDPDYQEILEAEKQNKDRVTLKRFLEKHIETQEDSENSKPEEEDDSEEESDKKEQKDEEETTSEDEDGSEKESEEDSEPDEQHEEDEPKEDAGEDSGSSSSSAGKGKEQKLNEVLDDLHEVQSVRGAAVVRRDGLLIASNFSQTFDENQVGAMTASTVGSGETASNALNMGEVNEVTIESQDGKLISTGAGEEGVLAVMTDADVNMGLIKVEMENATEKIKRVI